MAGEAEFTPRTEVEKGLDEGEGLTVKGSKMEGVSCKKTQSARLRRLELRRLNSHSGVSPVKRIRNPDENSESFSDASSSSSSPTRSLPSYPNADEATAAVAAETAAVGILASGGEMHGGNVEAVKFPCLSHGSVSLIGRRREMEDAVAVAPGFAADGEAGAEGSAPEYVFFAVYDGHGGAQVALACRDRLHVVLAEEVLGAGAWPRPGGEEEEGQWKRALAACFARVDGEVSDVAVRAGADAAEKTVGSTAVVAVVGTRRIVVANCGDSRAVLSRGGVALPLSSDHKPDRPDELERVEAAGGRVISWNGSRVLGVLATSRSIGDYYLKPYVIAEPEITAIDRMERDEFLILASDGLWDVVSNEVACRITRQCLTGRAARLYPEAVSGRTAAEAAALLAELAISRGSRDNISVVVVELKRLGSKRSDALGFQRHPILPKSL